MSFAGIVTFEDLPQMRRSEDALVALIGRHASSRRPQIARSPRAIFVQAGAAATTRDGVLFASSSRLDNRREIAPAYGQNSGSTEGDVVRGAFEVGGDKAIAGFLGAFAIAHWNERRATLALARDCMGQRSLFYHVGEGFVAFASQLSDLLALPDVPRELDERMLANFLALNHREMEQTFYRGVLRVPSRSVVRITPDGVERHHYWSPKLDAPPPYRRDEDYIARARELFDRAVRRTLKGVNRSAVLLSGGFDSSAVAATAAQMGIAEVTGYTGVPPDGLERPPLPGRYLDERSKVEALVRMHPALRVSFVTPRGADPRQSDPARFFADMPQPHRNICNVGWFGQIRDAMAAGGHDRYLNGSMGNMTLSWDGHFVLSELARRGRMFDLAREAWALSVRRGASLPRTLVGGLMPLLSPAAQRLVGRMRGIDPHSVNEFSLLAPAVIEELDLPAQWNRDGFDPAYRRQGSSAQLRAHQIFDQLQGGRDLAAMQAANEGLELRDPYADRELVEFCLAVPETLFCRNGETRWFARQVFADRLPPEILNETLRGEQAPNWFESLDARKPLIEEQVERIEASRLASRLIDLPRLKRLIADWPADAAAAEARMLEYRLGLDRAVHVGQFIRWVEGGNG